MDSEFYTGTDASGQPKDAIVKIGPSFALTNESGTGPYRVTYREQGVKNVFTRFPDYWDKESPGNADEIVFTPIKNDSTIITTAIVITKIAIVSMMLLRILISFLLLISCSLYTSEKIERNFTCN